MSTAVSARADAGTTPSLLGVDSSVTGRRWRLREADDRLALALSQRLDLPEVTGRVLAARGIDLANVDAFLEPTLREAMPDPSTFRDMETAADRLAGAIMQDELIGVFGDYDVDGATSSALLARYLHAVGARSRTYIPDRLTEGYGPNAGALLKLGAEGVSVIVTVDCGTTAYEPLAAAADASLDVIVVDHHEAEAQLPRALAVVNPKRLDEQGNPYAHLAAVGLTFMLAVATSRALRQAGWFRSRPEPDLLALLDLVALGTVCDVVPLTGLNRAYVTQGLRVMAKRRNTGLRALADTARIDEAPGTYHLGFILGPRVNAGGRVGRSDLGSRLLATDDAAEAAEIARQLDQLNRERQELEAAILAEATDMAERDGLAERPAVVVAGEGWHPGVIGIVASRLQDRFARPVCVVAFDGDTGSGSGRSVSGVDLGQTVIAARQKGLILKGGGHAMAAGFTVARDRFDAFRAHVEERVAAQIAESGFEPTLLLDGLLKTRGATEDVAETLSRIGPFGPGNAEPRFVIGNARLSFADVVGDAHVRCRLEDDSGGRLDAIAFRCVDGPLGPALLKSGGAPLHVAGKLRLNTWQGRTKAQLVIDDAAPAW